MNKRYRGMIAYLLAFLLCLGMIPQVFAAESTIPPTETTVPAEPAEGSLASDPPEQEVSDIQSSVQLLSTGDSEAMPTGGSSGSNTNLPGTNAPGGKGTLYFSSFGVTVQVVYHPYDSLLENTEGLTTDEEIIQKIRENSYDNIIDLVTDRYQNESYSNAWTQDIDGSTTTVYNGRSINPNYTFVIDPYTGTIYRIGQANNGTLDMTTGQWFFDVKLGGTMYKVSPDYTSVTAESDAGIENYIREICDGLGTWDKEDVAKNSAGGEAASASDDVSLYARVLEYLGCPQAYIENYVKAFTGQLAADSTELVPSIIWSFLVFEMQGQSKYATILPMANIGDAHTLNTDLYTADAVTNGKGGFAKSWWTKAFPYGESYLTLHNYFNDNQRDRDVSVFSVCHNKPTDGNSSWACLTAFGHNQEYYGGHGFGPTLGPNCPINAEGAGFVNHINADGVDEDSGQQYYFRGYWTAYGSPRIKPPAHQGQIGVKKAVEGVAADASSLTSWLFYVYRDEACTDYVTSIYTGSDGSGVSQKLEPGTYYVVEAPYHEQAGRGDIGNWYIVDAPVIPVEVEANQVSWALTTGGYTAKNACGKQVQLIKEPDCDPDIWDQISGNPMYSLAGAKYEVYSSDGKYIETLTTGADGKTAVSTIRFPMGFSGYVVEKTAPKGFLLNTAKVSFTVTASSPSVIVISVKDEPMFGSLVIQKADSLLGATPQGSATLAGAVFEVVNKNTCSVKVGDNPIAAPGEVCITLTADSKGLVTTDEVFPLGSYLVREKEAPSGYLLNESWEQTFSITESQRSISFTVANDLACYDDVLRGGLEIIKQDSMLLDKTDSTSNLDGITFTLYSNNPNPIVVDGNTYQNGDAVLTLEIAWNGSRWYAATAPDALPYGSYIVKENPMAPGITLANGFYFLNEGKETITIDGQNVVKTVTFRNDPRPAKITLEKVNYEGEHLAGAKFLLEWSEDGSDWKPVFSSETITPGSCSSPGLTDGCLVTPENGVIEFTGLDGRLQYRLTELEIPEGYMLLTEPVFEGPLPADTLELQFTAVNGRTFEIPKTGSQDMWMIPIVSLLCAAVGFCTAMVNDPKKKES